MEKHTAILLENTLVSQNSSDQRILGDIQPNTDQVIYIDAINCWHEHVPLLLGTSAT